LTQDLALHLGVSCGVHYTDINFTKDQKKTSTFATIDSFSASL